MNKLAWAALLMVGCNGGNGPNPPASTELDLNDVTFLYPLPTSLAGADSMLKFTSSGPKGQLLSRGFFDQVKKIDEVISADDIFNGMRIISARVDPCFPVNKPPDPLECRKQIRLVAQVIEAPDGNVTTRDGTIHLFFNMTDDEWAQIVDGVGELKAIAKNDTKGQPLDVHPTMKSQGLEGTYAKRLNTLITDFCGEQNLFRVAFMVAGMDGHNWNFGAFLRKDTLLNEDVIPRTDMKNEQSQREMGTETDRNTSFTPSPSNDDFVNTLLADADVQLADDLTLQRAVTEALRIESPEKESPQTIDCASCHAASRALKTAVAERDIDLSTYADRYIAPKRFDVSRVDGAAQNPLAQRALGYFGTLTALSQRTINESAAIADAMSPK